MIHAEFIFRTFQFRILRPISHKVFAFLFSHFTPCRICTFAFYTSPTFTTLSFHVCCVLEFQYVEPHRTASP